MADTTDYDVVIVGGGTAGSVLARRLADRGDLTVALIEAGPSDEGDERVLPVARWQALLGGELDYDYAIAPQERGNGRIRHSRARVLGGCSSHNSCIAFLTPDADLRRWVDEGATGWGPEAFAPYLARVKEQVHIHEPDEDNPFNHVVLEAAHQLGIPATRFNQSGDLRAGASRFQLNVKDGIRQSSSVAYLHPVAELPDTVDVHTDTWATRVVVEDGRATAVETTRGTFRARREVVLCAGAFDTPKLLMLSGIGPAAHLREVGIDVVADLPVGDHLLDHPEGVVNVELTRPLPEPFSQRYSAGIFTCVDDVEVPDLMFHIGLEPFTINTAPAGYPVPEHGFSLTPNVTRARSEGTVRLASADPEAPPVIDFRYFTDPDGYDERIMVAGVRIAREIIAQPALAEWVKGEVSPGPDVQSDEAVSEYVRTTANTVYHPAGTCRMGPDDGTTVVDPELRVHGVAGLRVADASIFPSMTTVNPGITVFAIGEKAADLVAGHGGR